MSHNPYTPPQANSDETPALDAAPALWNPNAAANWSLLLTPAFGAYLHMRNWQALGEDDKAANAKRWVMGYAAFLFLSIMLTIFNPEARKSTEAFSRLLGIGILFAWYLVSARGQAQYVKSHFGNNYPHKGWLKPILLAVVAFFGVIMLMGMLAFIVHGR